jgi:hypothetical protein
MRKSYGLVADMIGSELDAGQAEAADATALFIN